MHPLMGHISKLIKGMIKKPFAAIFNLLARKMTEKISEIDFRLKGVESDLYFYLNTNRKVDLLRSNDNQNSDGNGEIRFSFLLPCVKSAFLDQTLQSILSQYHNRFEIILVDDSQESDVKEVVKRFADTRIRYFNTPEPLGREDPTRTWNYGLNYVTGNFVTLIGDDDYIGKNYLNEVYSLIKAHPQCGIFRTRLCVVDDVGRPIYYGFSLPEIEGWDDFLYMRTRGTGRPHSTVEMTLNVDKLRNMGGYVSSYKAWGSDDMTWVCMSVGGGIASTNNAFAYWRIHGTNTSLNLPSKELQKACLRIRQYMSSLIEQHHDESCLIEKQMLINEMKTKY
jgi:hypothetical protein